MTDTPYDFADHLEEVQWVWLPRSGWLYPIERTELTNAYVFVYWTIFTGKEARHRFHRDRCLTAQLDRHKLRVFFPTFIAASTIARSAYEEHLYALQRESAKYAKFMGRMQVEPTALRGVRTQGDVKDREDMADDDD